MNTTELSIFVHAAQGGSLSEAARRLGLTPAVASRRFAGLESSLGTRLAHRSTRSFVLTDEGQAFLPHAETILDAERAAVASVRQDSAQVEGVLRVGGPVPFAQKVLTPVVARLLNEHPGLRVDLQLTDAYVDIVSAGVDVAIRVAKLADSDLIARRLGDSPVFLCAAPSYLNRVGRPFTVSELSQHDLLVRTGATHWSFVDGSRERKVRVRGRVMGTGHLTLRSLCEAGAGIALYAAWDAYDGIDSGRLERLQLDMEPHQDRSVWALYPTRTLVPEKVRIFIEEVKTELSR